MRNRPSHYHLVVDAGYRLREAMVALPGREPVEVRVDQLPLRDLDGFLQAVKELSPTGHLRHSDGLLYRVNRFEVRDGTAIVAVPTYPPPETWSELAGSRPIQELSHHIRNRPGLVLIMGDMGSGKTTVAGTYLVDSLKQDGGIALAWQDPIETDIEGRHGPGRCHQIEIDTSQYKQAGIDAMRSRCKYAFFGEAREPQTYLSALNVAMSGPQMLITSHGDNLINGLMKYASNAHMLDTQAYNLLAASLTAAIHLRLRDAGRGPELLVDSLLVTAAQADPIRVAIRSRNVEGLVTQLRQQAAQRVRGVA